MPQQPVALDSKKKTRAGSRDPVGLADVAVTPAMIRAGELRYAELASEFASAYLVEEVYLAMARASRLPRST